VPPDRRPHLDLRGGEIADAQQQIVDAVDGAHAALGREMLQLALDVVDGVAVEHVAQLGVAEQRLELRVIDRQRLGPRSASGASPS
jgi:hypothetical protein